MQSDKSEHPETKEPVAETPPGPTPTQEEADAMKGGSADEKKKRREVKPTAQAGGYQTR